MLSLHYNGNNSLLFVNAVKMYQFKAKDSEIKPYPLYLGNISKDILFSFCLEKTNQINNLGHNILITDTVLL